MTTLHEIFHLLFTFEVEYLTFKTDSKPISANITNSAIFKSLSDKGKMRVVAIYPDEDLSAWKKHIGHLSKWWLVTRYGEATARDAYDLPAIPNLYLLDKDKKVILKDATVEQIENWLRANLF